MDTDLECQHIRTDRWRRGKYESDGRHGPEQTRTVAGETLSRSWTHCLDCGMRLERGLIHAQGVR